MCKFEELKWFNFRIYLKALSKYLDDRFCRKTKLQRILVLILGGKHSAFHYYVWYQLLIFLRCSTRLKTLTCIPSLLRLFNQEGVLDSVKCFLCIYRDDHMTWFLVSWNQPWIIMGRTDPVAEAPILWPPDAKSWLTGKDPDAGKN